MNLLRRALVKKFGMRFLCSTTSSKSDDLPKTLRIEKLSNRGLVRVAGNEINPFLQGLITNDIDHLQRGSQAIYAMFLNKAGRILYDSIIYRTPQENAYYVECDTEVVSELVRYLKLFRVRRKIDVTPIDYSVWVVNGGVAEPDAIKIILPQSDVDKEVIMCHDPRLKTLGTRVIAPESQNMDDIVTYFPKYELIPTSEENDYTTFRYMLGVGEGIQDHPPTKSFPVESNGDYLHGISFQKGCYVGQEVTARTYHTGVIRKRLMPLCISQKIGKVEDDKDIKTENGAVVGKLRGHKNSYGLALIRIEKVTDITALTVNGALCTATRPFWWPDIMPKVKQANVAEKDKQT